MKRFGVAAAAVVALALVACGGGTTPADDVAGSTAPATAPASTAAASEPVKAAVAVAPTDEPTALPTVKPTAQGANAAPAEQFYDSSLAAYQKFWATWLYETALDPQSANRQPNDLRLHGIGLCVGFANIAARGGTVNFDATVRNIETQFLYSRTGAAGLLAASLRDFCPQRGNYATAFDRNVMRVETDLERAYGADLEQVVVGQVGTHICRAVISANADRTANWAREFAQLPNTLRVTGTPGGLPIKLVVRTTVISMCNLDIPPAYSDDSTPI